MACQCCRDWCDAAQYASYSQATCFSETIGVMGCNTDPNRCPPVFFTHPHSGLGLQAVGYRHDSAPLMRAPFAFCLPFLTAVGLVLSGSTSGRK